MCSKSPEVGGKLDLHITYALYSWFISLELRILLTWMNMTVFDRTFFIQNEMLNYQSDLWKEKWVFCWQWYYEYEVRSFISNFSEIGTWIIYGSILEVQTFRVVQIEDMPTWHSFLMSITFYTSQHIVLKKTNEVNKCQAHTSKWDFFINKSIYFWWATSSQFNVVFYI